MEAGTLKYLSLAAILFLAVCNFETERFPSLNVRLDVSKGKQIVFSVLNADNRPILVLKRDTPLEGIKKDILSVIDREGNEIPFSGVTFQRGKCVPSEFVILQPKESVEVVVDLSKYYEGVQNSRGTRVRFLGPVLASADLTSRYHGIERLQVVSEETNLILLN